MENYSVVKWGGLILLIFAVSIELAFYKNRISKQQIIKVLLLSSPFIYSILRSVSCFSVALPLITSIIIKLIIVGLFVLVIRDCLVIKALKFALYGHMFFFIIHALFLIMGEGNLYSAIIGLDTQTAFHGVKAIPFRPTGLFDEPSLFGMTILGLILGISSVRKKTVKSIVPFFTFSVPTMFVGALNLIIHSFKFRLKIVLTTLTMLSVFLFLIGYIFTEREATVKESPLGLRTMHLVYFIKSPNLYIGSGFCSAYGVLNLDLGRDELRDKGLGNFKDAGQLIFMADRVGVLPILIWLLLLLRFIPTKFFILYIAYLSLSKVIFFSSAGMISLLLLSKMKKTIVFD